MKPQYDGSLPDAIRAVIDDLNAAVVHLDELLSTWPIEVERQGDGSVQCRRSPRVQQLTLMPASALRALMGAPLPLLQARRTEAVMKSDADVVYDERKGKLFINDNGTKKGWGEKKVGGLIAKFKGKPELSAEHFDELTDHGGDAITGGEDIKDQIATFRESLSDADESRFYGETLINPTEGIKRIRKAAKKEGYSFDKAALGDGVW